MTRRDDIRAAVIDSLADDSGDCPVCGSADVSNAAGPIRSGQWWYRCRGCGFDRFGPAREPVRDGDAMTYPISRIVAFTCAGCGAVMHQPEDDENRLCLNCRYPIPGPDGAGVEARLTTRRP